MFVIISHLSHCIHEFGIIHFVTKYGRCCGFALHDSHAASWPGKDEIRIEPLTGHSVVPRPRRMVYREHDFRHDCSCHRLDKPSTRSNDSRVFRLRPDHEPADVLHKQDREALSAGGLDEVSNLFSAFRIDYPAKSRRSFPRIRDDATLIRDHGDLISVNCAVPAQHLARYLRLELVEPTVI